MIVETLLNVICFIVNTIGIWISISVLAGIVGFVIPPLPKQYFVGIPAGVIVIVLALMAINTIFGIC